MSNSFDRVLRTTPAVPPPVDVAIRPPETGFDTAPGPGPEVASRRALSVLAGAGVAAEIGVMAWNKSQHRRASPGPKGTRIWRFCLCRRRRRHWRLTRDQIAEPEVLADLERRKNWNHPAPDHQRPDRLPAPARPRRPVRPAGPARPSLADRLPWTLVLILVAGTGAARPCCPGRAGCPVSSCLRHNHEAGALMTRACPPGRNSS